MKKIINHLRSDWYKYTLELIVITAGILGAFMLNSWKEDRDRQGEEAKILSGLKQEFEANLSEVDRNIELNSKTVESCVMAIELLRSVDPFADSRYFDSLMQVVYMYGTFDAQTGLVNEVISSGKLSIISDPILRNRLTSLSGMLDNAEEDYEIRANYYMYQILPFMSPFFPMANQDQYMDFSSWSDSYKTTKVPESPFPPQLENLNLLQFENHIYHHKVNNDFVNLNEYGLRKFFFETLEIINSNLSNIE